MPKALHNAEQLPRLNPSRAVPRRVKSLSEESEKAGLKLNIQKTKIMASGPISSVQSLSHIRLFGTPWTAAQQAILFLFISWSSPKFMSIESVMLSNLLIVCRPSSPITSWQIDGETVETLRDFIFLGSKITADGDCSHEIKRHLLLGRKAMTNLDSILKSRDSTLLTKICLVKAIIFPIVTYGCESWIIKKAESQRIDAFELRCWSRLLRVPWTARRVNQSILKETNPENSFEGLMLKLKLQNFAT